MILYNGHRFTAKDSNAEYVKCLTFIPKKRCGKHGETYCHSYAPPAYNGGGSGTGSWQFTEQCLHYGVGQLHCQFSHRRMDIRSFAYQYPDGDKQHEDIVQPDRT